MEDWYAINNHDYAANYGQGLMLYYFGKNKGISDILIDHYPDYDWKKWQFNVISDGWWHEKANRREYCDWLFDKLKFKKIDDWYMVMKSDFNNNRGASMFSGTMNIYSKLSDAIVDLYPEYEWDVSKFGDGKKNQQRLFHIIKTIFPNDEENQDQ